MSLADLTAVAVRQAIAEFDRLGRDAFLDTYGFGRARDYFLFHNGQSYDSKAIAGVANQFLPGQVALTSGAFSGGENAAAGRLRELGFDIRGPEEQLASLPTFEPGAIYSRARQIHDVYGGQRQGGISTPRSAPLIFLFTGETGDQYGYRDGPRDDGIFAYTGEGQSGDMEFVRGNLAIRDHIRNGRDLLLFEKLRHPGSNGICESCDAPAPFRRSNGEPYLEPHHTRRLADGGPDHPLWVGAVCPACHREIHHGELGRTKNDMLQERLKLLERQ